MFSTQRANYQSFVTSKYRSKREQKSTIFTLNIGVYLRKLKISHFLTAVCLHFFLGDVPTFTAVQGSSVELPCNITPPIFTDRVRLVLYFRNDSAVPIYT